MTEIVNNPTIIDVEANPTNIDLITNSNVIINPSATELPPDAARESKQDTIIGLVDGLLTILENPLNVALDIQTLATEQTLAALNNKIPQLSLNGDRLLVDANVSLPSSYTVDGAVSVLNFPATQAISGTVIANQGGTWNIGSITTLPSLTLASESGFLTYRNTSLSNTAQSVKSSAGSVMGWNFINVNTVPAYVKFYDTAAASVVVGTTAIVLTILVPPSDGVTPGMFFMEPGLIPTQTFSNAISVACVMGLADNSTAAPSTAIHVSVRYK